MRNILIIIGRYLPGYKNGGPIRTIKNLADNLGEEYNFKILTLDRDTGDDKRYDNINADNWNRIGNSDVFYVEHFSKELILEKSKNIDLIYICGCFDDYARYTLGLKRRGKIKIPIVIASMGLFSHGAFNIKKTKKQLYMTALRIMGYFKDICWSASTEIEAQDIKSKVGKSAQCYIAEDLPRSIKPFEFVSKNKKSGELNIAFLSRISPEKNLHYTAEILKNLRGDIHFSVYGFIEDREYWEKCKKSLSEMSENVSYEYMGTVDSEDVIKVLQKEHIFFLPTLGENYGHVILEAMMASCPVIISDETPWKDLESNQVGYAISLADKDKYIQILQQYVDMEKENFEEISKKAFLYAKAKCEDKSLFDKYRTMLNGGWK